MRRADPAACVFNRVSLSPAARQFNLNFAPLIEERFDLLVGRKAYFDPPAQKFAIFRRSDLFFSIAQALGGYRVGNFGAVRCNGP